MFSIRSLNVGDTVSDDNVRGGVSRTTASCFVMIIAQSAATSGAFALRYHDSVDEDADILRLGCCTLGYMPVRDGRAADAHDVLD